MPEPGCPAPAATYLWGTWELGHATACLRSAWVWALAVLAAETGSALPVAALQCEQMLWPSCPCKPTTWHASHERHAACGQHLTCVRTACTADSCMGWKEEGGRCCAAVGKDTTHLSMASVALRLLSADKMPLLLLLLLRGAAIGGKEEAR